MATLTADHLTDEQIDALGTELDALRAEVVASLGERDARYIHKIIRTQRGLDAAARALLLFARFPPAWIAGTAALSVAKILENMELGHNIMHGQWDWMRDPKIHSTTWEWDHASAAEGWKKSHNFEHHTFTNVLGKDRDLGYSIMRISPDQKWHPAHLAQPVYNQLLALFFEWGVAFYDLEVDLVRDGKKSKKEFKRDAARLWRKARRQLAKDYVLFPALSVVSGPQSVVASMAASFVANCVRNFWAHAVIFCGHFPEGVETFPEEQLEGETRGRVVRAADAGLREPRGGPLLHTMTGNLSHQIEHHIFPDIPSNRYAEIAPRVREICDRYGLSYTIGPMRKQYGNVLRRINRYALPAVRRAPPPGRSWPPRSRPCPCGPRSRTPPRSSRCAWPADPGRLCDSGGRVRRLGGRRGRGVGHPQRDRQLQARTRVVQRLAERLAQRRQAVADRLRVHVQGRGGQGDVAVGVEPGAQRLLPPGARAGRERVQRSQGVLAQLRGQLRLGGQQQRQQVRVRRTTPTGSVPSSPATCSGHAAWARATDRLARARATTGPSTAGRLRTAIFTRSCHAVRPGTGRSGTGTSTTPTGSRFAPTAPGSRAATATASSTTSAASRSGSRHAAARPPLHLGHGRGRLAGEQLDEGVPAGLHGPGVARVLVGPSRHRRRPELLHVSEQRLGQREDHVRGQPAGSGAVGDPRHAVRVPTWQADCSAASVRPSRCSSWPRPR